MLADGDELSVQGLEAFEWAQVRHGRRGEFREAPQRILPTDAAVCSMLEAVGGFSRREGGGGVREMSQWFKSRKNVGRVG